MKYAVCTLGLIVFLMFQAQASVIGTLTNVEVATLQQSEVLAGALNSMTKSYSTLDDRSQVYKNNIHSRIMYNGIMP